MKTGSDLPSTSRRFLFRGFLLKSSFETQNSSRWHEAIKLRKAPSKKKWAMKSGTSIIGQEFRSCRPMYFLWVTGSPRVGFRSSVAKRTTTTIIITASVSVRGEHSSEENDNLLTWLFLMNYHISGGYSLYWSCWSPCVDGHCITMLIGSHRRTVVRNSHCTQQRTDEFTWCARRPPRHIWMVNTDEYAGWLNVFLFRKMLFKNIT